MSRARTVLPLLLLLALARPAAGGEEALPKELKSVDCSAGELYLILSSDGTFVLVFERAGPEPGTVLDRRRETGRWQERDGTLRLEWPNGFVEYAREPVRFTMAGHTFDLQGVAWRRSERAAIADACKTLVDRVGLERAVHRFAPPPPPR